MQIFALRSDVLVLDREGVLSYCSCRKGQSRVVEFHAALDPEEGLGPDALSLHIKHVVFRRASWSRTSVDSPALANGIVRLLPRLESVVLETRSRVPIVFGWPRKLHPKLATTTWEASRYRAEHPSETPTAQGPLSVFWILDEFEEARRVM